MILLTLLLVAPLPAQAPPTTGSSTPVRSEQIASTARYSLDEILDAIRITESGGHGDGRHATGDGGRAIGPYQIHRSHWLDARLAGQFENCRDPNYARRVVIAYWKRWCPEALERRDAHVLARVHNGGPSGATKAGTMGYWGRVERALTRMRAQPSDRVRSDSPPARPRARAHSASVCRSG